MQRPSHIKMAVLQAHRSFHCTAQSLAAIQDYYTVLGVRQDATTKEIKTAYYLQSKKHHPDIRGDDPSAATRFALINEAYTVLSQVALRREYDQSNGRFRYQHAETGTATRGGSMTNTRRTGPLDYKTQYNFEEFYKKHYGESIRRRRVYQQRLQEHEHLLQESSRGAFPTAFILACFGIWLMRGGGWS